MAVPDLKHVVRAVRDSKRWPFRSKEQLCTYAQACIKALHKVDSNFGNLEKAPAQNHCVDASGRRHATDVAFYKPTGQAIDFIVSAGFEPDTNKLEPENSVGWGVGPEGEYPESKWYAPVDDSDPIDPPLDLPPVSLDPRVVGLESEVVDLKAKVAANAARIESINNRIDADSKENVKKPLPVYVGTIRILGFSFNLVSRPR